MTFLQTGLAKAAAAGGYQIARSLRFNSADTAYLNRTPGSAGNRKTFTISIWFKRSSFGVLSKLISAGTASGAFTSLEIPTDNTFKFLHYDGATVTWYIQTTQVFRDPSAWAHLLISVDTTQATSSNRLKMYMNGSQITALTSSYPTQNSDSSFNAALVHQIGNGVYNSTEPFSGYMADIRIIDGQQLDPTSFGEFDTNTGVWMPKTYSGTYGTNGFWLKLDDNSGTTSTTLGKDSSGNSNNWTPNNFSVTAGVGNDSLVDSPTNYGTDTGVGGEVRGNYANLNALDNGGNTLTDGNLSGNKGAGWASTRATMAFPTTGKWYWEAQITAGGNNMTIGIATNAAVLASKIIGEDANGWGYVSGSGLKWTNGSSASYGATWTAGDIMGIAFDAGAGTLTFYKNNTSQGTAFTGLTGGPYFAGVSFESTTGYVNFGQRPFAYTAPSGFKALCTQNLPTPAIGATSSTLAGKQMNVVNWTGTGTTQSVTGVGFQPDFVWVKRRDSSDNHSIFDAVRGTGKYISSNLTNSEATDNSSLTTFGADGFTSGGSVIGGNGFSYVAWNWKGGNGTVSNTSGSITSTVSANTTAGISVVKWTGNGTDGATVGHGLGVTPAMIIIKNTGQSGAWIVQHKGMAGAPKASSTVFTLTSSNTNGCLLLNSNGGAISYGFDGQINGNTYGMIAYCFTEVAGFSKFGSFVGNGSTDGPFVYCGFRPKWILIKDLVNADTASWLLYDTARNTYNVAPTILATELTGGDNTNSAWNIDIVSNGFKIRSNYGQLNNNGSTFIFTAFAEAPFNYSRAR